jgi:uncharacterized protein YukE
MRSKSFIPTVFLMSLGLVLVQLAGSGAMAQETPTATNNHQGQGRVDTEMMSHQKVMADLLASLQKNLQAVVSSRDAYGYIHDKAAVKAYKADLDALRDAVHQHKSFAADCERWYGPNEKQNVMAEHQQRMRGILFDLSDTFYTYLTVDDHSIEGPPNKIEDALVAHRDALNDFASAIQEHEQAMAQMMTHASDRGSL